MKRGAVRYTPDELDWVRANATMTRIELHQAFCARFARRDVSQVNLTSLRKRNGWLTGRTGQYLPGASPQNKGQKMPWHPNSAATRFQKGAAPANQTPLGTERLTQDGYVEINVPETNPHTGHARRYRLKHLYLWEQENGPVPKGKCLKCLDGDRTNTAPENWALVPRGLLPRLNGKSGRNYDAAPEALKPTIMATAKLEHAAREIRRGAAGDRKQSN